MLKARSNSIMCVMKIFHSEQEYVDFKFIIRYICILVTVLSSGFNYFCIRLKLWDVHWLFGFALIYTVSFMFGCPIILVEFRKAVRELRKLSINHGYYERREGDGFLKPLDPDYCTIPEAYNIVTQAMFWGRVVGLDEKIGLESGDGDSNCECGV